MKYKMKLVAFLLSLFMTACAATTNFKWDSVRALKVGMTRQEIIERMGPPHQTTVQNTVEGLKEIYVWFYVTYDLIGTNSESVSVEFLNGKVISLPTVPDSYKDND